MPATFTNNGDGTVDINFVWPNVPIAKAEEIAANAALYDWRRGLGPIIVVDGETVQKPYEDLMKQELLDMDFEAAQCLLLAQARTARVNTDMNQAREDAIEYVDDNYQLE